MTIVRTQMTIQCDHPSCEETVVIDFGKRQRTISDSLKACGWQPYKNDDLCPEHQRDTD